MTEQHVADPSEEPNWLVVVGASAGGIEALTGLLAPLRGDFPAAIVIAQHLQPSRESHLGDILTSRTQARVVTVERQEPLRVGTVYLVPADHHVTITDHHVDVAPAEGTRPSPSIDRLLATAADTFGERLIAVILSGMGSDGVIGAGAVKAQGGTVIIQNPETASHPAMPRALPPTIVDFVANTERMGDLLIELVAAPLAPRAPEEERLLPLFLNQVRDRTGIDFAAYKRGTVQRRLQRRMIATANPRLRDYVRYAQQNPEEYQRLASTFLIKVTEFFRDADLFEHLREVMLPQLIESARGRGRELRIWSAGCATGEEAYSLAILVAEALGEERDSFTVRIFATDLDEEAISFARRGVYAKAAVASVPGDMLARWFVRNGDEYEVDKGVRQLVVFGQHDLGQRAPFPRIDLALCRNVLIYFTTELQKRALQLFAFSLRDGGYLALGKAESTTPHAEHFILDQPRLKVYRRAGERILMPSTGLRAGSGPPVVRPVPRREPPWATSAPPATPQPPRRLGERPEQLLLRLPVGIVVIDAEYEITFVNAAARRLLGIHGEALGQDFIHLTSVLPSEELRSGVAAAVDGETVSFVRTVALQAETGDATLRVVLQPYRIDGEARPVVLVMVQDVTDEADQLEGMRVELDRGRQDVGQARERMERLARANRDLLHANEELTSSNILLRTSNEDLLVANEEVQAATEEVETLNEELQATNEELETLNEELQATVEELNTTNDDLEAQSTALAEAAASLQEQRQQSEMERVRLALILDGMSESVMVLDRDGTIIATNRSYNEEFGGREAAWRAQDPTGRDLPEADWPQARAARGETFTMSFSRRTSAGERRWYEATGRGESIEWGAVVVIRDISDRSLRHLQELFIAAAGHELQTPMAALRMSLQVVERDGRAQLDAATAHYLDAASDQARQLAALGGRLFDMAIARHGRLVLKQEAVDLREMVRETVDTHRLAQPDARFALRLGSTPVVVPGDELRLRQVVSNILGNAVTHGASGTPVTITLHADGEAQLVVADRGPGLPDSVRANLFIPFATGDLGRRPSLGLGLYLAHEIIEEHAGTLEIGDRRGGGTLVTIRLPLHVQGQPKARRRRRVGTLSGGGAS